VWYDINWIRVQPIPLGVTFSNAVSKLKARSSIVFFHWNVAKETFELWALSFRNCHPKWDRVYMRWTFAKVRLTFDTLSAACQMAAKLNLVKIFVFLVAQTRCRYSIYVYMYKWMRIHIRVDMCIHIYMYIWIYIHMHTYMWMYINT